MNYAERTGLDRRHSIQRLVLGLLCGIAFSVSKHQPVLAAGPDVVEHCASVINDDAIRPMPPSLSGLFSKAFAEGNEVAKGSVLQTAVYRCMAKHLFGCIIGANLPCSKISTDRSNSGADAYCKENPRAADVPMVASGHDSNFDYTCDRGRARVQRQIYKLDQRGFAQELWKRLD